MAVRVSQLVGEIQLVDVPHTLVTQIVSEVQVGDISFVRTTQLVAEVLSVDDRFARASQIYLLVLCNSVGREMPAVYPTLIGLDYSVIKRPITFGEVGQAASGREVRIAYSDVNVWEWELTYSYLPDFSGAGSTTSDMKTMMGFFLQTRGNIFGFLFKDPDDHHMTIGGFAFTDGVTSDYTISRFFNDDGDSPREPIGYVDTSEPVQVYLDADLQDPSSYDVVTTLPCRQQIHFHSTPASGRVVAVTCTFYFYVRFKDPQYDFEKFANQIWSLNKIVLRSLKGS